MSTSFVWIAEAPHFPGVYAIEPHPYGGRNFTVDANSALHFPTREACQAWIGADPKRPKWEPREHGFDDGGAS